MWRVCISSTYFHFFVESAQIAITSDNVTMDAGNTVMFACVGYGTPDPDITWTRGGNQLTNDSSLFTIYEELVTEGMRPLRSPS